MFYNHFYCVPRGWLNEKITHYLIFTRYFAEEKSEHERESSRRCLGVFAGVYVCDLLTHVYDCIVHQKKRTHAVDIHPLSCQHLPFRI